MRVLAVLSISVFAVACGGPSSPEAQTEAQVITNTSWSGGYGIPSTLISGNGNSDVFTIGVGRQCLTLTKHGSSDINNKSTMTVRVGENSATTPNSEFTETRTVCGTGPLR